LVGFSVEPVSGGKDLGEFADDITEKVGLYVGMREREICHFPNDGRHEFLGID